MSQGSVYATFGAFGAHKMALLLDQRIAAPRIDPPDTQ